MSRSGSRRSRCACATASSPASNERLPGVGGDGRLDDDARQPAAPRQQLREARPASTPELQRRNDRSAAAIRARGDSPCAGSSARSGSGFQSARRRRDALRPGEELVQAVEVVPWTAQEDEPRRRPVEAGIVPARRSRRGTARRGAPRREAGRRGRARGAPRRSTSATSTDAAQRASPPAGRAGGSRGRRRAAGRRRRGCSAGWSRARRGPAAPGSRAGRRRSRAGGWRRCGAGCAGGRPGAVAVASTQRSRTRRTERSVSRPPRAVEEDRLVGPRSPGRRAARRSPRARRAARSARAGRTAPSAPCPPCRATRSTRALSSRSLQSRPTSSATRRPGRRRGARGWRGRARRRGSSPARRLEQVLDLARAQVAGELSSALRRAHPLRRVRAAPRPRGRPSGRSCAARSRARAPGDRGRAGRGERGEERAHGDEVGVGHRQLALRLATRKSRARKTTKRSRSER